MQTTTPRTVWDEDDSPPEDLNDVGISRSFQSSPQLQKIFNGHAHAQVSIPHPVERISNLSSWISFTGIHSGEVTVSSKQ